MSRVRLGAGISDKKAPRTISPLCIVSFIFMRTPSRRHIFAPA